MKPRHLLLGLGSAALCGAVALFWINAPMADPTPENKPLAAATSAPSQQPPELGLIGWERDFQAATARATRENKPLLVLFDEVPGCQTVLGYGRDVLSHPLLVEAAETLFVPVVVYNNIEGPDRQILESFGEPTWNNPVVRLIKPNREALAPRLAGDYSPGGLARSMSTALQAHGQQAPAWLSLLAQEEGAHRDGTRKATFAMYCFWSGEAHLGKKEGVVGTRTGFLGGHEVVEVEYDPRVLPLNELIQHAQQGKAADGFFAHDKEAFSSASAQLGQRAQMSPGPLRPSEKDDRYQLRHTAWRYVPMTPAQAARANASIGRSQDPSSWFSPRQLAIYRAASAQPGLGWPEGLGRPGTLKRDFAQSWQLVQQTP